MSEIISYEIKKIIQKPFNRIILLIFVLICISSYLTEVDPFGKNLKIVDQNGEFLEGRDAIEFNRMQSKKYYGELSDKKILLIENEFELNMNMYLEVISKAQSWEYTTIYQDIKSINKNPNIQLIKSVSDSVKGDQRYLNTDEVIIGCPRIWGGTFNSLQRCFVFLGIVLIILIAPIFSEEYQSGMAEILLVSSLGRIKNGLVLYKILTALILSTILSLLVIVFNLIASIGLNGLYGMDCTIQLMHPYWFSSVNEIYSVFDALLWGNFISLISMYLIVLLSIFVSVANSKPYHAIIKMLALYLLPAILLQYYPNNLVKILFPLIQIDTKSVLLVGGFSLLGLNVPFGMIAIIEAVLLFVIFSSWILRIFKKQQFFLDT